MLFRRAAVVSFATAVFGVAACGGGAPTARPASASSATDGGLATTIDGGAPPIQEASHTTLEDHRREFIGGCSKKAANTPDYCECAWAEFQKVFTNDEMTAGDMPPQKLEQVKTHVSAACSSKISEQAVKDRFSSACVGQNPDLKTYCECTWAEFRKHFTPAELADEATVTSERFAAARAPVVKACGAKMPEQVSKDAFMKGCAKDTASESFCGCAWKELRKQASPAAIESGTFDQKTVFAQLEKSCGKLRPPAK